MIKTTPLQEIAIRLTKVKDNASEEECIALFRQAAKMLTPSYKTAADRDIAQANIDKIYDLTIARNSQSLAQTTMELFQSNSKRLKKKKEDYLSDHLADLAKNIEGYSFNK